MNTSVYKRKDRLASMLTLVYIFLLLSTLLAGCGQQMEEEEEDEELSSEPIPEHIRKSGQPTVESVFGDPRSAESADPSGKKSYEKTPQEMVLERADAYLENAEWSPKLLQKAKNLLSKLEPSLPRHVRPSACQQEAYKKIDPSKPLSEQRNEKLIRKCNQWAIYHTKLAEVSYYSGEVIEPQDDYLRLREIYNNGKIEADNALSYNPYYAAALLWWGSNRGAWLSMSIHGLSLADKIWIEGTLTAAPSLILDKLLRALQTYPEYDENDLTRALREAPRSDKTATSLALALGRALHKLPTANLEAINMTDKDKNISLAIKFLKIAANRKHRIANFYLFELFSDKEDGEFDANLANEYARKVKKVISTKEFKRKYPINARRQMNKISEFEN